MSYNDSSNPVVGPELKRYRVRTFFETYVDDFVYASSPRKAWESSQSIIPDQSQLMDNLYPRDSYHDCEIELEPLESDPEF